MNRTSVPLLVAIAIIVGLVSHMVLAYVDDHNAYPLPVSALTPVLLAILAVVLWRAGLAVKKLVARQDTRIDALGAARVAMLAKSSSFGGAGLTGYFAAQLVIGLRNVSAPLYAQHAWVSAASALVCVGLVVVALIVESWCAIPPDDDERGGGMRGTSAA